jgi:Chaperone of endosialidase
VPIFESDGLVKLEEQHSLTDGRLTPNISISLIFAALHTSVPKATIGVFTPITFDPTEDSTLNEQRTRTPLLLLALALVLVGPISAADVTVQATAGNLTWHINGDNAGSTLTLKGPDGVRRLEFDAGSSPIVAAPTTSGTYTWELTIRPSLSDAQRAELERARARGIEPVGLPQGFVASGTFTVAEGAVTVPVLNDIDDHDGNTRDFVIADDLIVDGSACVGFDCVNNEDFGFDTIRLKENNLRIKFEDTSTGSFPTNDWQLTANDSASGGQAKFSIEDITGSRVPFTVEAGATTNSIYVDSTGRVGFRTATPSLDLHVSTSNTPAIRLEQTAAGGFTAQTWDIAGNEANFFVRDVTGGSRLSFRIRPGAPTSSIDIAADGDVGIGTASPGSRLHVAASSASNLEMFTLALTGGGAPFMQYNSTFGDWDFSGGNLFVINDPADAAIELQMDRAGNVTTSGTVNGVSDVNAKADIRPVDAQAVLQQVMNIPISTWRYKTEEGVRNLGPMAQDFYSAFGLGISDKLLAPANVAGVALAAIQGLSQELDARDAEIAALRAELVGLQSLKVRLDALEAKISQ